MFRGFAVIYLRINCRVFAGLEKERELTVLYGNEAFLYIEFASL